MTPSFARLAAAIGATALLATACATTVQGEGSAGPGAASSPADFPSEPTATVPGTSAPPVAVTTPVTVPSSPSPPRSAPPRLATRDITNVRYKIPKGFAKSTAYRPVTPLEHTWTAYYLVPKNERAGLDVLSIVFYKLPASARVDTLARQRARIHAYDRRADATVLDGPHLTAVGGVLAIQQIAEEPPDFKYSTWFVFGRHHLLQVSCQVNRQVDRVANACQKLVDSIDIG